MIRATASVAMIAACALLCVQAHADVDVTRYVLDLEVDFEAQMLLGQAEVLLVADGEPLVLDFVGYEISSLTVDGEAATFTREGGLLRIEADTVAGQEYRVEVRYAGTPDPYVEPWGAWGVIFEQERVFTLNVIEGAKHWFPCHDTVSDRAALTLSVTAPEDWLVAAPGVEVSREVVGPGVATTTWRSDWAMPTYHMHFAAAPYVVVEEEHGGIPFIYWFSPETNRELALDTLSHAPTATALWVERYGEYPFPKVGFDEIDLGGAVENTSCVSIGHQILNSPSTFEEVIAHEMAHAWFQGIVTTATWEDLWLSEGLATYHEALYYEHLNGPQGLRSYARSLATGYKAVARQGEGNFPVYDPDVLFGVTTYRKGAMVFHQLRYLVGDETFDLILNTYLTRHRFEAVTTADFQAVAEDVSSLDLEDFFAQWVYGAGLPDYRWSWSVTEDGQVALRLRQLQEEGPFTSLPVEFALRADEQEHRVKVWPEDEDTVVRVDVAFVPTSVGFDPDSWLLKDVDEEPWFEPEPEPEPDPEPDMGADLEEDTSPDFNEPDLDWDDGTDEPEPDSEPTSKPKDDASCQVSTTSMGPSLWIPWFKKRR